MLKSKIQTSALISSDNFRLSMGDGYTVISLAPNHHQQIMVKTDQLDEFVEIINHAKSVWVKAKVVEKDNNVNGT